MCNSSSHQKISFLTKMFERMMRPLDKLRPRTISQAHGRVVEIGIGSGLNLPYYRDVQALYGIEPDLELLQLAKTRAKQIPFPVELFEASAEALPFEDHFFDTAVVTWVFCMIPDAKRAAQELARVLKPHGQLLYIEHTRSPFTVMSHLQSALSPAWERITNGCRLTRDPHTLFQEAGFQHTQYKGIRINVWNPFPMYAGIAYLDDGAT